MNSSLEPAGNAKEKLCCWNYPDCDNPPEEWKGERLWHASVISLSRIFCFHLKVTESTYAKSNPWYLGVTTCQLEGTSVKRVCPHSLLETLCSLSWKMDTATTSFRHCVCIPALHQQAWLFCSTLLRDPCPCQHEAYISILIPWLNVGSSECLTACVGLEMGRRSSAIVSLHYLVKAEVTEDKRSARFQYHAGNSYKIFPASWQGLHLEVCTPLEGLGGSCPLPHLKLFLTFYRSAHQLLPRLELHISTLLA